MSERPLHGVRVIDLADERGEMIGRLLADLGAEVIRVEPPEGAVSRRLPPFHGEHSLYFSFRNAGKLGVCLDIALPDGRDQLHRMLAGADVLVESFAPGHMESLGLGPGALLERYPGLVITSFSAFGSFGPCKDWTATDTVLEAMGGMMFKAGAADKPPLAPPGPLAHDVASVTACYATLLALHQRLVHGAGQWIDFSALLGIAQTTDWSYSNASISRAAGAPYPEVRSGSGPAYKLYKCRGGYVRLVILSRRQWRAMWEWLGRPEEFADAYWEQFVSRLINADVLNARYEQLFADMDVDQVSIEAQRRGIVCTPVLDPQQVLDNEHLRSRGTFVEMEAAPGVSGPFPSGFMEVDGRRQGPSAPAPEQGQHDEFVFADLDLVKRTASVSPPRAPDNPHLPLAGLHVLDFGLGGVGVECARLLGDYGASVIKVESREYPDFIRVITGSEMSTSFASSSRGKRSFGINLKRPESRELIHKLVKWADVLVENNATGVMENLGVGYEALSKINPELVMVSSQLLGARGAWANWIGYGPSTQPIGGLVHLWDYEAEQADETPAGSTSIFPDHAAGRICAVGALAALYRRRKTGAGAHVEVAQIETVTGMLGDLLWKAGLEPGSVRPRGNRSERGAPFGAYPCAGEDQWCVITVRDDSDWRALCSALGEPEWAKNPEYGFARDRFIAHDAIDEALSAWTRKHDKYEVARRLQEKGVPCGPVLTGGGQHDDPQFLAWEYGRTITQPELVIPFQVEGPCFRASAMPEPRAERAPQLGEHTREIAMQLLGLPETEVDKLLAAGVLEGPPPPEPEPEPEPESESGAEAEKA